MGHPYMSVNACSIMAIRKKEKNSPFNYLITYLYLPQEISKYIYQDPVYPVNVKEKLTFTLTYFHL